jgi:hypothetical protein
MKLSSAILAICAAMASANPFGSAESSNSPKSAYINQLMRGATVIRGLQEQQQRNTEQEYEVDISGYSIKFQKCQFVKSYDDDLAMDEESESVLATKRFVVFRLCPNHSCSSCNNGYGEYMIDLETYLYATIQYQQEMQQTICNACAQCGNNGDDAVQNQQEDQGQDGEGQDVEGDNRNRMLQDYYVDVNCNTCYSDCVKFENMEAQGFVDASNFIECSLIYDPEDDGKSSLYAGPMCASQGSKINIGVFTDENCYINDSSKTVDDYVVDKDGYPKQLSHVLLKSVYASDSCISCTAPQNQNQNDDGNNQDAGVLEMCSELYEASAKCEQSHGFDRGYTANSGYANQQSNEEVVCDFIDSISAGSYDEQGEIVVYGASSSYGGSATTTGGQKFALTFFIFGTMGLAMYAGMLHSKLTRRAAKGHHGLGGGAMA